jgi:hypothetical protein
MCQTLCSAPSRKSWVQLRAKVRTSPFQLLLRASRFGISGYVRFLIFLHIRGGGDAAWSLDPLNASHCSRMVLLLPGAPPTAVSWRMPSSYTTYTLQIASRTTHPNQPYTAKRGPRDPQELCIPPSAVSVAMVRDWSRCAESRYMV